MNTTHLLIFVVLFSVVSCDQYGSVLKAIDSLIAQQEQKQHLLAHTKGAAHQHTNTLQHDLQYTDDYSLKDFVDGVSYVETLNGAGKPTLPVFTDKDKSDFSRLAVPNANLSEQEQLHQQLTQQQTLLDNKRKEQELKRKTLDALIAEEERLKNPLHDVPTFASEETQKQFVEVCTATMPNGIPCPGGRCYNGKCKLDKVCYDDCCDGAVAKDNGVPCKGGNCLSGRCRAYPTCIGECCMGPNNDIAKPNGAQCAAGHCFEGGCTADVGCVVGECCNMNTKRLFPKGFPCHASACQHKSFCTGKSAFCPETENKEDGSICVGGTCSKGVCAIEGITANNSTAKMCSNGICCDVTKGTYLPKATPCSNNPCKTGGSCSGYSSECTSSSENKQDGTICPNGKCYDGQCIAVAQCKEGECCKDGMKLKDYSVCNGGRCFKGDCVKDVPCWGECCKPANATETDNTKSNPFVPQLNGFPCNNNTDVCQSGFCVSLPLCVGECCDETNMSNNFVAADGKLCNQGSGKCLKGYCISADEKCTNGTCCNEQDGILRSKGFPCSSQQCSEPMFCTGTSTFCPTSLKHKENGTPCHGGTCMEGKCTTPPQDKPQCVEGPCCDLTTYKFFPVGYKCGNETCRETTYCTGSSPYCPATLLLLPDETVCKLTDKASTDWKCQDGICREPLPTFSQENVDIDMTRNVCNSTSPCCNSLIGRVRPKGYICSIAQSSCMKDVVCDGETAQCNPFVIEDGGACPGGACVNGFCVKGIDPTDTDAVHEVHLHIVSKEVNPQLSPEEALRKSLADDDEEEEDSGSLEELMTIITKEADGRITERKMRIPLNAIENAKKKSLSLADNSTDKADKKAASRAEMIEAEARKRLAAKKMNNTLAQNATETESDLPQSQQPQQQLQNSSQTQNKQNDPKQNNQNVVNTAGSFLTSATSAFSAAYPMPQTGVVDPLTGVVRLTDGKQGCQSGQCCDIAQGVYYSRGFQCAAPKNLCKVAACTGYSDKCYVIDRPDGAVCPSGKCFEGECVHDCVGECCDHHNVARPDGVVCGENGNGFCFDGTCVKNCTGECCNEFNFAKADGSTCTLGFCLEGKCLQTRDNMNEDAKAQAHNAGIYEDDDEFYNTLPTYTHQPPRNMEEEWSKMMKKEEQKKYQDEVERAAAKKQEKELADAKEKSQTEINNTLLKASNDGGNQANTFKIVGFSLGGAVVFLAIVAIIVAVVAHNRKKAVRAKEDEYYDKF